MRKTVKDNRKRKVDKNWEKIFEEKDIINEIKQNGYFTITSTEINEYREARLMTKFDSWTSLPYIFQDNQLNILPVERGKYIISHFNAYKNIEINHNITPIQIKFPRWIKSLEHSNLTSEEKALNCAYASGILDHVMNTQGDIKPTISGRMSSNTWEFKIEDSIQSGIFHKIKNDRSQCQIDGGFESRKSFCLIEAKNSLSEDFIVRQLYYPYRMQYERFKYKEFEKPIQTVYLIYTNGIFHFLIYRFLDPLNYSSLELVKQMSFKIKDQSVSLQDIYEINREAESEGFSVEPDIPFPQADTFERVVDLIEAIKETSMSKEEISLMYDFEYRQADYYSNAGRYLGYLEKKNGLIELADYGERVFNMNKREKFLRITKDILKHKVFHDALNLYFEKDALPTKSEIYEKVMLPNKKILYKSGEGHLNETTLRRRASSVLGWIAWIIDLPRKI